LDFERRVARSKCASELSVARRCQSRKRASTVTVHGLGGLPPGLGGLPPPSTRAPSFATVPPLFRSSVAGIDSLVKHAPHSGRDVLMRCLPRCHPRRWKEADLQEGSNPVCASPGSWLSQLRSTMRAERVRRAGNAHRVRAPVPGRIFAPRDNEAAAQKMTVAAAAATSSS
jgi:hypothetical protein